MEDHFKKENSVNKHLGETAYTEQRKDSKRVLTCSKSKNLKHALAMCFQAERLLQMLAKPFSTTS